jgi:drug/metabolite transporter (DMT)-like permease
LILFTIVGFFAVAIIVKYGSLKKIDPYDLCFSIYFGGAILSGITVLLTGDFSASKEIITYSIAGGMFAVFSTIFFMYAMRIGHYGFSVAILASSFIIPVIFSFIAGWEKSINILGITLTLIAVFLMSYAGDPDRKKNKNWSKWFFLIILSFFFNGAPQVSQAAAMRLLVKNILLFTFLTYAGALLPVSAIVIRKRTFNRKIFILGLLAAAGSMTGIVCSMQALKCLPPSIVFPSYFTGYTLVGVVASKFIFKEKISVMGYFGIALAIFGLVILSRA